MHILGLDYGSARIGLAIGDRDTKIASPWGVLRVENRAKTLQALQEIIQQEEVTEIVIGLPRRLHDQQQVTQQAEEIQAFAAWLQEQLPMIPILFENETWSSQIAARQMLDREERGKRDDLAAVVILQGYLDRLSYGVS